MQEVKATKIKEDIADFYLKQSGEKTQDLEAWLNSGNLRIPESKTYYYFEDRKIQCAIAMAKPKPRSRILEIGCNLGQMTFPLSQIGFDMTGVDLSKQATEKAQLRANHYKTNNVRFISHDAENISSLNLEPFDTVFSFSAVRYMPNPASAIQQMYTVLKSGGCAVVDFPNKNCPWFNIMKPLTPIKKHIHDNYFTEKQVKELFEKAGFHDISCSFLLFSHKGLPSFLVPILKLIDFILERLPIVNKMSAIIMVKGLKP